MANAEPDKKSRERIDREIDRVGGQAQLLSGTKQIDGTLKSKLIKGGTSGFKDFLELVENGFAGKAGVDANKPYGKSKAQRPKLRILEEDKTSKVKKP